MTESFGELNYSFYTSIATGVKEYANSKGYCVMVASSEDDHECEKNFTHLFSTKDIKGTIIAPVVEGTAEIEHLFKLKMINYPFVLLEAVKIGADLRYAVQLCKKSGTLDKKVKFIPLIPYENIVDAYRNHDITIGVFKSGIISTVGLESWAVKRPILNYINSKLYPSFE